MIRRSENSIAVRAGIYAVLVHALLFGVLLISVNWKSVQPMSVAEVELWDKLPSQPPVKPPPVPKPEPVVEPKPEPKPVPKPDPEEEPKADIQVKKEKVVPPKVEKPLPPEKPKELPKPDLAKKELDKKKQEELIKKMREEFLAEDSKPQQEAHKQQGTPGPTANQASQSEINGYTARISSRIRQYVNKELCSNGNPELQFSISLMPTGDVIGTPRLLKGSGSTICDEAVERAIIQSQPLPVPKDPGLFSQFRDLKLKFRPNDAN